MARYEVRTIYKDGEAFGYNRAIPDPAVAFANALGSHYDDPNCLRMELIEYKNDTKTLIAVWDREGIYENGEIQSGNRKRQFHNTHMS